VVRRGIIHVHSVYSYDGKNTLEELAALGRRRRYDFIGVTEHSDTFDRAKMAAFVAECRRLSDRSLILMPGIEFSCAGRLHLLALGIEQWSDAKDPVELTKFIQDQGGLAVVSHPSRYAYQIPSRLVEVIDGVEVWNASYDSRFVPDRKVVELWRTLKRDNEALTGFGGQDLHRITPIRHVTLVLPDADPELTAAAVVGRLRKKAFFMSNGYLRLGCAEPPGWAQRGLIAAGWRGFRAAKWVQRRLTGRRG
jgi:predicted metal-dependent phosphoesterase TrpH